MGQIDHEQLPLLWAMKKYAQKKVTSFDVPGHKRGKGIPILNDYFSQQLMALDTNALPMLDHAGNPTGVIKEAQALLADAYGADEAFFMTNGSTSAIQVMLMSVLSPGDKILMPKNIHKSALNGLILCGGIPIYMKPEICIKEGLMKNVSVNEVRQQLDASPDVKAVFLLNPTYFGYTSDLSAIASLCHERDVLLLVDEAHGAHFPFCEQMPASAMASGAHMSAISVHKTGGALTQASALVVKEGRVDINRIKQVVNILQTTSASYLLMGSLDAARYNLVKNGRNQINQAVELAKIAHHQLNEITGISVVFEQDFYDITKLVINVSGLKLTGFEVYELLWQKYNIQLELCETNHVLAIISLGDDLEGITKLVESMADIAKKYLGNGHAGHLLLEPLLQNQAVAMSPRDAYFSTKKLIPLKEAIGEISGESIMAYPPGIPIISPGELITSEVVRVLKDLKEKNAFIVDNQDPELEQILVVVKE